MRCSLEFDALYQSTESPILFRWCGHETPFSDQKWASKIGDSVFCFVFCKIFARWVYLYTRMIWHDAMRCSRMFDALYFVKYLQDGFTSTHAWLATWDDKMRCVALSSLMLCIEVKYLQDGFTSTHAWDNMMRCAALSCLMLCDFVKYLQDGFTSTHAWLAAWDVKMRCVVLSSLMLCIL